jgi:LTXXQ motif family protein
MNLYNVNPKLGVLSTMVIGAILMTTFHSVAMANPSENYDHKQMNQEKMHEHMKVRLDKLAERLEIKSSQQAVWEEFANSIEMLADRNVKKPNDDADAATISRYRAERATEFSDKLTKIADATAKLQAALSVNQRKILDQTAHRFLHYDRRTNHTHHRMDHDGSEHGWDLHGNGAS